MPKPDAVKAPPPHPSEGGTYVLENGELRCVQQTLAPDAQVVEAAAPAADPAPVKPAPVPAPPKPEA